MIDDAQIVKQVQEDHRIAYPIGVAAGLLGISRQTLWRVIKAKKLFPFQDYPRVIARRELERFATEQTAQARKPVRVPRSQYKPVPN